VGLQSGTDGARSDRLHSATSEMSDLSGLAIVQHGPAETTTDDEEGDLRGNATQSGGLPQHGTGKQRHQAERPRNRGDDALALPQLIEVASAISQGIQSS
jgi:hypothetical protein